MKSKPKCKYIIGWSESRVITHKYLFSLVNSATELIPDILRISSDLQARVRRYSPIMPRSPRLQDLFSPTLSTPTSPSAYMDYQGLGIHFGNNEAVTSSAEAANLNTSIMGAVGDNTTPMITHNTYLDSSGVPANETQDVPRDTNGEALVHSPSPGTSFSFSSRVSSVHVDDPIVDDDYVQVSGESIASVSPRTLSVATHDDLVSHSDPTSDSVLSHIRHECTAGNEVRVSQVAVIVQSSDYQPDSPPSWFPIQSCHDSRSYEDCGIESPTQPRTIETVQSNHVHRDTEQDDLEQREGSSLVCDIPRRLSTGVQTEPSGNAIAPHPELALGSSEHITVGYFPLSDDEDDRSIVSYASDGIREAAIGTHQAREVHSDIPSQSSCGCILITGSVGSDDVTSDGGRYEIPETGNMTVEDEHEDPNLSIHEISGSSVLTPAPREEAENACGTLPGFVHSDNNLRRSREYGEGDGSSDVPSSALLHELRDNAEYNIDDCPPRWSSNAGSHLQSCGMQADSIYLPFPRRVPSLLEEPTLSPLLIDSVELLALNDSAGASSPESSPLTRPDNSIDPRAMRFRGQPLERTLWLPIYSRQNDTRVHPFIGRNRHLSASAMNQAQSSNDRLVQTRHPERRYSDSETQANATLRTRREAPPRHRVPQPSDRPRAPQSTRLTPIGSPNGQSASFWRALFSRSSYMATSELPMPSRPPTSQILWQ